MNRRVQRVLTLAIISGITAGAVIIVLLGYGPTLVVHPGGPHEELCMGFTRLNSPTNMSLNVLNCGSYAASPHSYYVKDPNGNVYPNPNWSTPTIPLNANVTLNIVIDGNAFTFQRGFYYTITINTSRANYGFTVTA